MGYEEIEEFAWHTINECVRGKKGCVKLQSRLELVAGAEQAKIIKSEKYGTKFIQTPQGTTKTTTDSKFPSHFPSKQQYEENKKKSSQRKQTDSIDGSELDELAGTLAGTFFDDEPMGNDEDN